MSEEKKGKTLLFNNGELLEKMPSAIVITGTPNLSLRAYHLLDILAKKLIEHILTTRNASELIIDHLTEVKALRTISITVEEYASMLGLNNLYIAQDRLTHAGLELNSFFTSYNNKESGPLKIEIDEERFGEDLKVGFLQNLTTECKVFEGTGNFELEFNPNLAAFLIKKYRDEQYKELRPEDYTVYMLLRDVMLLGLSYISDFGFDVKDEFPENEEELESYIKDRFILG